VVTVAFTQNEHGDGRRGAVSFEALQYLEAIHGGQVEVEQYEMGYLGTGFVPPLLPIIGKVDVIAQAAQEKPETEGLTAAVFNQ
jgi:hypothetical protein